MEDEESARNEASEAAGAKPTSRDLLSSLAARERSARERAAEAELAAQRAADHRRAAEERLARYREGRRASATPPVERPPSAPVQLEILRPAAEPTPSAGLDPGAGDPELLAQIDAAERSLAQLIADERRLVEEIQQLESRAGGHAAQLAPAETALAEARAAEQEAGQRLDAARSAVAAASSQASSAQADARHQVHSARDAVRRAELADEELEAIVIRRSSAFQRAIEHATLEQDASARAGAARRAAQQAAAQRLAAERALDGAQRAERLARLRAAVETSIDLVSEGEGIEGEAAPRAAAAPAAAPAPSVVAQIPQRVETGDVPAEPLVERLAAAAPSVAAEGALWAPEVEDPGEPGDPGAASESTEEDAAELERPAESPWWLAGGAQEEDEGRDESEESSRADEQDQRFLASLFSEDAFRGEAESTIAEEAAAELAALDEAPEPVLDEPSARPPVLAPLRPRAESAPPRRDESPPRRERAAAELARIERVASQQSDAARKARHAEGQRVEAERDAYEAAASQWRSRQRVANRGPGLYAEHDYAWEEQAAIGVQRKLAREDEIERRRRSAQEAAEQAAAAQRAAEQLRAPSVERNEYIRTLIIVSVVLGVTFTLIVYMLAFQRAPEIAASPAPVEEPAPEEALASLEPQSPPEVLVEPTPALEPAPVTLPPVIEPPRTEIGRPAVSEIQRPAVSDVASPSPASPSLAPTTRSVTKPDARQEDWPAWRRYAVPAPDTGGKPMIAIVIDDMGSNREVSGEVIQLPAPITVSFFPWVQRLERQAEVARAAGHEIMAHVPMEPQARSQDPGPNYLGMSQSAQEIRDRLRWNLDKFDFGIVGINNHMGSRFTSSGPGMGVVMAELLKRQMLFLDSRTTRDSVGAQMAAEFGLPYAVNDLFLDNEVSAEGVLRRLDELEERARRKGSAIAIGHPHRETVAALRAWIPRVEKRGFVLVPLSAVVKHQMTRRAAAGAARAQPQARPVPQTRQAASETRSAQDDD